jgi:N-methylhydantoinase A
VSEANLVLGYLNPDELLGGRLPLDREKARAALKKIADPLGISVERAAYGMFTIVIKNAVNGIRRVRSNRAMIRAISCWSEQAARRPHT